MPSATLIAAVFGAAVVLPPALAFAQPSPPVRPATTVFTGTFITLDSLQPRAEAMAVRDGRIVALGSARTVDAVAGAGARRVALPGVVLPGFADAHVHAPGLGDYLSSLDLRGKSKREIVSMVRAAAARARPGEWIAGAGWDQSFWTPPDFPTAAELDDASLGHPVILDRIDGHATWVNSRALQLAKLGRDVADPPGGRLTRDARGAPNGVLVDAAIGLVRRAMPPMAMDERVRRLRRAVAQYSAWGLTEIHDAGLDLDELQAWRRLAREGPLAVRVYAMASADSATFNAVVARGPEIGAAGGTFTLRTIKIVDDGALGSRGARLAAPYADAPGERGFTLVPHPRLDTLIARALRRGFQVAVHAIGDASMHDVLDAFERAGPAGRSARFRAEHASIIPDRDLPRLAALGVIASMQPVFVGEYSRFAEARVGAARLPWVYRVKDVVASGAVLASGTDFPASDTGDPIGTLFALVTRRGWDGTPTGGWLPGQKVSLDVALRSMTMGPAFAAFEEKDGGMLRVGRRADLTVLSADPYAVPADSLRSLRVLRTVVGGRVVHSAVGDRPESRSHAQSP